MEITEARLLDFMEKPNTHFVIPRFQRAYSWKDEQCDELWRDLFRAARVQRTHFLGTLIYTNGAKGTTVRACDDAQSGAEIFEIIDGQQRLTTISLLLMALMGYLDEREETLFGANGASLASTYLLAGKQAKLALSRTDDATLSALVHNEELPSHPSARIIENYTRFKQKMAEDGFDVLQLWRGLESLTVMAVRLDNRSKAPDVFESFNSKGVPLVTADMVRNYLLLSENRQEQTRLYETYWTSISNAFGDDPGSLKLNNAILGWLTVRFRGVRKFGDAHAFSIFKSFCEDDYDGTTDDLLEELYAFCLVWAENYRYHAVKKYKSADWAKIGRKTRVSDRERKPPTHEESWEYYKKHFGVDPQW